MHGKFTPDARWALALLAVACGLAVIPFLHETDPSPTHYFEGSAIAWTPTPQPTASYSSAPAMECEAYIGGIPVEEYDTKLRMRTSNPITVGEYLALLSDITYYAEDFDTVDPNTRNCPPFFCRDISHPGPPDQPSLVVWPLPSQVVVAPSPDTVVIEDLTLTQQMIWYDNAYFGDGGTGDSRNGCGFCSYGVEAPETQDSPVSKFLNVEIVNPCKVSASVVASGPIYKGRANRIAFNVKRLVGQGAFGPGGLPPEWNTGCAYTYFLGVVDADPGVEVEGVESSGGIGLLPGEESLVEVSSYRPSTRRRREAWSSASTSWTGTSPLRR